jgi:transposase
MNTNAIFGCVAASAEGRPALDPHLPSPPTPRLQRPDRARPDPYPLSLDDRIPAEHPVRALWDFVTAMDLAPLYAAIRAVEGHPGRPAIDPRILVALWLYATLEGIGSAHALDQHCRRDDAFKWLCGGVSVNYHTLADFRTDHADWLEEQLVWSVAVLRRAGLVDLNQIGQDGLRVRASAGSSSFQGRDKLQAHLAEAQQQWDRLQAEAQADPAQLNRRQQKARERAARGRLERLRRAQQEWQQIEAARERRRKGDGAKARASTTDPEARRMKMPDGGFRPAYNVQFATTLDHLVVVGVDVTNAGSDGGQMDPMVAQIEQRHQHRPAAYFTDGSFATLEDIAAVSQRGVTVYTPVKDEDTKRQQGQDPFAPRPGDAPAVAAWRQRMGTEAGRQAYRQRSKCEWTNATCRQRGLYQVVVRGLAKVRAVALWYGLMVNFLRALALRAEASAGAMRAEVALVGG